MNAVIVEEKGRKQGEHPPVDRSSPEETRREASVDFFGRFGGMGSTLSQEFGTRSF
jgi:hypothetical protein